MNDLIISKTTTIKDIYKSKNVKDIWIEDDTNLEVIKDILYKKYGNTTRLIITLKLLQKGIKKTTTYLSNWFYVDLQGMSLTKYESELISKTNWYYVNLSDCKLTPDNCMWISQANWNTVILDENELNPKHCMWISQAKWHTVKIRYTKINTSCIMKLSSAKWHTLNIRNNILNYRSLSFLKESDIFCIISDYPDFDSIVTRNNLEKLSRKLDDNMIYDVNHIIVDYLI